MHWNWEQKIRMLELQVKALGSELLVLQKECIILREMVLDSEEAIAHAVTPERLNEQIKAGMAEMEDAVDSSPTVHKGREGSTPSLGTKN